jgi:peptidyl-prolyl cis-trans isomerase B (cyclophilin B)
MHQANAGLDGQYTAFGRITSGIEVVDKMVETPAEAGSGSVAVAQRPKLNSIKVLPAKAEDYQPK